LDRGQLRRVAERQARPLRVERRRAALSGRPRGCRLLELRPVPIVTRRSAERNLTMNDELAGSRRRFFLASSGIAAAGLLLSGCESSQEHTGQGKEKEVTANEDLMREYGVLRRALLIYRLSAARLRINEKAVAPDGLNKSAVLFRAFGEDYHERQLEEPFIFPAVRQARPSLSALVDTLMVQHQRGREITDYIIEVTRGS